MKEIIITSTIDAFRSITQKRFFKTERGYQGKFYCMLQPVLESKGIITESCFLEMEYQKRFNPHRTKQRPDIILHIPTEVSNESEIKNNFAVWALKYNGKCNDAINDFKKLDLMFQELDYPLGFFINIGSDKHWLDNYRGQFPDRITAFAVRLTNGLVHITQANIDKGRIIETEIVPQNSTATDRPL